MWDAQVPALTERFRLLRYDHPGHGGSHPADVDGMGSLARGVLDLLDELGLERVSFCGVSLGGAVGMRLALEASEQSPTRSSSGGSPRHSPTCNASATCSCRPIRRHTRAAARRSATGTCATRSVQSERRSSR